MTHVFGPILPHLAEEIHHTRQGNTDPAQGLSVFANRWKHLDSKWFDPIVESEMKNLLRLRATVLSLLEKARREK
jgi:isoleucyl-tRNA synthetase